MWAHGQEEGSSHLRRSLRHGTQSQRPKLAQPRAARVAHLVFLEQISALCTGCAYDIIGNKRFMCSKGSRWRSLPASIVPPSPCGMDKARNIPLYPAHVVMDKGRNIPQYLGVSRASRSDRKRDAGRSPIQRSSGPAIHTSCSHLVHFMTPSSGVYLWLIPYGTTPRGSGSHYLVSA